MIYGITFSNPYTNSRANENGSPLFSLNKNKYSGILDIKKKYKPKYGLTGASFSAHYILPTGKIGTMMSQDLGTGGEGFIYINKLYFGFGISVTDLELQKDMDVNIENGILKLKNDARFLHSLIYGRFGYSAYFKKKIKITPYYQFGYSGLDCTNYTIEEDKEIINLYDVFSTGIGVKALFIAFNLEDLNLYNARVPTTFGFFADAGFSFQFINNSNEFKGHTGYMQLGVFFGITHVDKYRY
ncbi:MAG: hypothetical protein C0599_16715 [Salinivirgaceae bacterium]|nr:MAG: hypothetical protein C0599_16715 [Salinivirgaceae bacterium]